VYKGLVKTILKNGMPTPKGVLFLEMPHIILKTFIVILGGYPNG
jgi:hypothetical protein